jgi:hypothetical protein
MEYSRRVGQEPLSRSDDQSPKLHVSTILPELEMALRRFATRLRRDYAAEIARDARGFKKDVVRLLRRELPPGPGRPPDEAVTRATNMRAKDQPWATIYCQCIPGYGSLNPGDRQLAASRLRTAVRSRRNRREQNPAGLFPQKILA